MDKWSFIPKEPSFPAFFLGALSVGIYPSDTFLKLEVCRTPFLPYPPIFLGHGAQLTSVECSVTPMPRDLLVAPYDRNPATSLWQRSGLRAEPPVVLLSVRVGSCGQSEVDCPAWKTHSSGVG